ncbi:MAG: hypothetical protein HOQ22_18755 [Nocardioidaceae bacterium]|nr:hypothetical protein [Nocardioidaceae bacterium]NUS53065.1 hypothetical protein [Nocardioidaceae bacterium]
MSDDGNVRTLRERAGEGDVVFTDCRGEPQAVGPSGHDPDDDDPRAFAVVGA